MIPEGWEVGKLGDIANIKSGKRPSNVSGYVLYPNYGGGIKAYTDDFLFEEDIIVTGRVGTIGKLFRLNEKVWPSDNALVLIGKEEYYYNFLYLFLIAFNFSPITGGSTQPLITQTSLKNIHIIIPPVATLIDFNKYLDSWFKKLDKNIKENMVLSGTRNYLLPKLLTGEIDLTKSYETLEDMMQ